MTDLKLKIYQIKTGDHIVCFIDPMTNKRKRKKFESKNLAKIYQKDLELRYQARGSQSFNQTLVKDYIRLHLEKSPDSRLVDRKRHFKSFSEEFGGRRINQVGKNELSSWFQQIKTKHDLSDRTLNTIKSDLNSFFHFLEDENVITDSPLNKIKFERKPQPRRKRVVLSKNEIFQVLQDAKVHSPKILHPVLFIAAFTGARRSEVLKLKRKDVDFETGLIHFRNTKNGEDRALRVSHSLKIFLEDFLKSHESDFVIPYKVNEMIPRHIITKHLVRFRKLFPIGKHWGPHSLRHSFAYNFLKQSGNMYQLQAILGHKSIDVTVDTYGQIAAQDVESNCPYEDLNINNT